MGRGREIPVMASDQEKHEWEVNVGKVFFEVRAAFDVETLSGHTVRLNIGDPLVFADYHLARTSFVHRRSDLKSYWNYFTVSDDEIEHNCRVIQKPS